MQYIRTYYAYTIAHANIHRDRDEKDIRRLLRRHVATQPRTQAEDNLEKSDSMQSQPDTNDEGEVKRIPTSSSASNGAGPQSTVAHDDQHQTLGQQNMPGKIQIKPQKLQLDKLQQILPRRDVVEVECTIVCIFRRERVLPSH